MTAEVPETPNPAAEAPAEAETAPVAETPAEAAAGETEPAEAPAGAEEAPAVEEAPAEEPKPYVERMKAEYRELKERYDKLHRIIVKYEAGTLDFTPTCPIELLKEQAAAMGKYLYVLEVRAEIEGVAL